MNVVDTSLVGFWETHSRFPFVKDPFFVYTDFPWQAGELSWGSNDEVVADYELQAIYPAPVFVPHVQTYPGMASGTGFFSYYAIYGANIQYRSGSLRGNAGVPSVVWQRGNDHVATTAFCDTDTYGSNLIVSALQGYSGGQATDYSGGPVTGFPGGPNYNPVLQAGPILGASRLFHEWTDFSGVVGCTVIAGVVPLDQSSTLSSSPGTTPTVVQTTAGAHECYLDVIAYIGLGRDSIGYKLRFSSRDVPTVYKRRADQSSWQKLRRLQDANSAVSGALQDTQVWEVGPQSVKNSQGSVSSNDAAQYIDLQAIEWRLIGGRLELRIGAGDEVYVFEEGRIDTSGKPVDQINRIEVLADGFFMLGLAAHPMKFQASASFTSSEIPIGFTSPRIGDPKVDLVSLPSGWSVTMDPTETDLLGPIAQYTLDFAGPVDGYYRSRPYSSNVAAVRAVNLVWLPAEDYFPTGPSIVTPAAIDLKHTFDLDTLEIASSGALIFPNNLPTQMPTGEIDTWSSWGVNHGQVGCEIQLGRNTPAAGFVQGSVFSGYANVDVNTDGVALEGWQCAIGVGDRRRQLMSDRWALPWMDGWNVYYAIAYLAQLGGVSISEMNFAPYIPSAPFGPGTDLGSPEGLPAYYLPVGDQGSVLTRNSGMQLWELMRKIGVAIGYLRFFDAKGFLSFQKFGLPQGVKRYFFESDPESTAQPGGGLEGCWECHIGKDMSQVRSETIIAGVNAFGPAYQAIVYRQADDGVVFDGTAFNHLGYRVPFAWIDSQFADESYAYRASVEMMAFLRNPGLSVTLTTWSQPDIFPLDGIMFQSPRAGTQWIPLMVTEAWHHQTLDRGRTTLKAQYVPLDLF